MADFDMVVVHRERYFGIDFYTKKIEEITFEEAFGHDVFDWDRNICMASSANKEKYKDMRGKNGTGLGLICKMVHKEARA